VTVNLLDLIRVDTAIYRTYEIEIIVGVKIHISQYNKYKENVRV